MANIQMLSDAPVVCSKCRCLVCRIVLGSDVCRCGVAHGKPSELKQVCARCYELVEAGTLTHPTLGIVAKAVSSFEQTLMDDAGIDDAFDESDEADFSEEALEDSDDEEFMIDPEMIEEPVAIS